MPQATGFLNKKRQLPKIQKASERIKHFNEFTEKTSAKLLSDQSERCMDCGIPFCHNGCPLGNIIPDFNDAVYHQQWKLAYEILISTNNFPEFTGRICPAPCESACVLGINQDPVSIELIEKNIIEIAFENGFVKPCIPQNKTDKKIAIVGSGPAGLACADQLNQAGYSITVFERTQHPGGLLTYGIPDFKLEKNIVLRRTNILQQEGIMFKFNTHIGQDISIAELEKNYDVIVLAIGSSVPIDIDIKGNKIKGIHYAMDFLAQQNHKNLGNQDIKNHEGNAIPEILATDKNVIVIGSGDTASDCIGVSNRQNAKSITQIARSTPPPLERHSSTPWPMVPYIFHTSSSQEEGVNRQWQLFTKEFIADANGNLTKMKFNKMDVQVDANGNKTWNEIPNSEIELPCDLALIAIGFKHPQHKGIVNDLNIELDKRGNIKTNGYYQSSKPNIFVAGDARIGQSLVVNAISEGRECAFHIDTILMGTSTPTQKNKSIMHLS